MARGSPDLQAAAWVNLATSSCSLSLCSAKFPTGVPPSSGGDHIRCAKICPVLEVLSSAQAQMCLHNVWTGVPFEQDCKRLCCEGHRLNWRRCASWTSLRLVRSAPSPHRTFGALVVDHAPDALSVLALSV